MLIMKEADLSPAKRAYEAAQQKNWQAHQAYQQACTTGSNNQIAALQAWLDTSEKKNKAFWAYYRTL